LSFEGFGLGFVFGGDAVGKGVGGDNRFFK